MTCTASRPTAESFVAHHAHSAGGMERAELHRRLTRSPLTLVTPWASRPNNPTIVSGDRELAGFEWIETQLRELEIITGCRPHWVLIFADVYAALNKVPAEVCGTYLASLRIALEQRIPGAQVIRCSELLGRVDDAIIGGAESDLRILSDESPQTIEAVRRRGLKIAPESDPLAYIRDRLIEARICERVFGQPVKLSATAPKTNIGLDGTMPHLYLPHGLQNPWRHYPHA